MDDSSRRGRRTPRKTTSSRVTGANRGQTNGLSNNGSSHNISIVKTPVFNNSDEAAAYWANMDMVKSVPSPGVASRNDPLCSSIHSTEEQGFRSPGGKNLKQRAEHQRQRNHGARIAKKERRKEIKSSLANFLHDEGDGDGAPCEEHDDMQNTEHGEADEDDSLISEEDPVEPRPVLTKEPSRRSLHSTKSFSSTDDDDASARSERRRRRMRRSQSGDDRSLASMSRRGGSRRVDDGTSVVSSSSSSRQPGGGSRRRRSDGSVGDDLQRPRRMQGEPQKRPDPRRKMLLDSHSNSKSTIFSTGSTASGRRRRSDRSGSDDSNSARKGGPSGRRSSGTSIRDPDPTEDGDVTAAESSEASLSRSRRTALTLSNHLEKTSMRNIPQDIEEVSEESSRFSFGNQSTLLQFDPTNDNNVKAVRQDKARVTSETIRHSDGTESKLHIHKLDDLPTFEMPETSGELIEVSDAGLPLNGAGPETKSDVEEFDLAIAAPPPPTALRRHKSGDSIFSCADRPPQLKRNKSGGLLRGVSVSKSFLRRTKKGEGSEPLQPNGDGGEDEKKKGRLFGRLKTSSKLQRLAHQALDDDSEDEYDDPGGLLS